MVGASGRLINLDCTIHIDPRRAYSLMRAVLDTNVLVSVLVYADPRFECVRTAWESGRLRVLSSIECLAELRPSVERSGAVAAATS